MAGEVSGIDWPAWVQAIGSVVGIGAAIWIASGQNRQQRRLLATTEAAQRLQAAETVKYLAQATTNAINHVAELLDSRDKVYDRATRGFSNVLMELEALERRLSDIPTYQIPAEVLELALLISRTLAQFREKIVNTLEGHRAMGSLAFEDYFKSVADIKRSAGETTADIEKLVIKWRAEVAQAKG